MILRGLGTDQLLVRGFGVISRKVLDRIYLKLNNSLKQKITFSSKHPFLKIESQSQLLHLSGDKNMVKVSVSVPELVLVTHKPTILVKGSRV